VVLTIYRREKTELMCQIELVSGSGFGVYQKIINAKQPYLHVKFANAPDNTLT
jgi:hypothetical protein